MASPDPLSGPLSFASFLEKMKDPAAADLVRHIKGFIRHFEERSSTHRPDPEADSAAVQDFFYRMEAAFRAHPCWRGAGPEVIDQAIEGLEKYVMSKIWPRTFASSLEDRDRDERYHRLAQALSFVDLSTLMGADVVPDEVLLTTAVGELLRMDRYKAPRDKLLCLVNVKTLVEDIVAAAARSGAAIGGADAFFPAFLLVVIKARLPRLASNIEYIRRFRGRPRLSGQFDYMLCNLESAAMYLDTVDWKHLKLSQDEFLARLAEAGLPEAEMELRALRGTAEAAEQQGGALITVEKEEQQYVDTGADTTAPIVDLFSLETAAAEVISQQIPPAADGDQQAEAVPLMPGQPIVEEETTLLNGSEDKMQQNEEVEKLEEAAAVLEKVSTAPDALTTAATTAEKEELLVVNTAETKQNVVPQIVKPDLSIEIPSQVDAASDGAVITPKLGLTPLGTGPETPILMKQRVETSSVEEQAPGGGAGSSNILPLSAPAVPLPSTLPPSHSISSASVTESTLGVGTDFISAMVSEGTALVLHEESEGRLQQKHPWIYASAEDMSIPDVRALLASYRDLVLKYEAITLSLKQQVSGSASSLPQRPSQMPASPVQAFVSDGLIRDVSGHTTALLSKLTSWARTPSGRHVVTAAAAERDPGASNEAAAAVFGKALGSAGGSGDSRLLHSLFGTPTQATQQPAPTLPPVNSTGKSASPRVLKSPEPATTAPVEGSLAKTEIEQAVERAASPALGLIEQPQSADQTDSLI